MDNGDITARLASLRQASHKHASVALDMAVAAEEAAYKANDILALAVGTEMVLRTGELSLRYPTRRIALWHGNGVTGVSIRRKQAWLNGIQESWVATLGWYDEQSLHNSIRTDTVEADYVDYDVDTDHPVHSQLRYVFEPFVTAQTKLPRILVPDIEEVTFLGGLPVE